MHGEPHVSVCIRAHSRTDALRSAIASALSQTYTDLEVVVSDDSGRLASGPLVAACVVTFPTMPCLIAVQSLPSSSKSRVLSRISAMCGSPATSLGANPQICR